MNEIKEVLASMGLRQDGYPRVGTESGKARGGRFTPRPRSLDEVRDSILRKLEALDRHGEEEEGDAPDAPDAP